jgi:1,4-dihydroxy-2-naphthoate octaprenyltransferase
MKKIGLFLGIIRAPFLLLTPACVLLGLGSALRTGGPVSWSHVALALVGAVCAHISVNTFNEYFDFKSGLDARTQRTPFSGGSGTLPAHPQAARLGLITAVSALALTASIGAYFAWLRGPLLLLPGLFGLFIVVAYTPWLTRNPLVCLIAPGVGFGPLMVLGTAIALSGRFTWTAAVASLVPFFLVSDLLLLNQFPDVEADRSVGRRHIPIRLGRRTAGIIYNLFLLGAYLAIVLGVIAGVLPGPSLFGLLSAVLAIPAGVRAFRQADDLPGLAPALGMNVLINLITPLLVGIGLLIR